MSMSKDGVTAQELIDRRKSGVLPEITTDHLGISHYWRRMAILDNDVRLADDICMILEALHSPVSTHVLHHRRKTVE